MSELAKIEDFIGRTFNRIELNEGQNELTFYENGHPAFVMTHTQNCCEDVHLNDITGDLKDLINTPIVDATEVSSDDEPPLPGDCDYSYTWTFYRFRTIKGTVVLRWYGTSNGYYSEDVDIVKL